MNWTINTLKWTSRKVGGLWIHLSFVHQGGRSHAVCMIGDEPNPHWATSAPGAFYKRDCRAWGRYVSVRHLLEGRKIPREQRVRIWAAYRAICPHDLKIIGRTSRQNRNRRRNERLRDAVHNIKEAMR